MRPTLPAPPIFDGIEFIEFAVDDEAGRRLGEQLRDLGLHYAGRHRSKSVDLFRQGRVNFVLNSEKDSAASEHFQLHGPSVCAMALRVDDAAMRAGARSGAVVPGMAGARRRRASGAFRRCGRPTAR